MLRFYRQKRNILFSDDGKSLLSSQSTEMSHTGSGYPGVSNKAIKRKCFGFSLTKSNNTGIESLTASWFGGVCIEPLI